MTSREKYLIISSDDKDFYSSSNSDFTVTLKEKYNTQSVDRVHIKEVIVPNAFYNISNGNVEEGNGPANNILILKSGDQEFKIEIPSGQYNIIQLIATLEEKINAVIAPNYTTIQRDEITNILTFTITGSSFSFSLSSSIKNVLGFTKEITNDPINVNNYIMQYPPDLSGINSVYIHSSAISDGSGIDASAGIINLVDSISMHNVPYGTFAFKQNNDSELCAINYLMPRNLNVVDIRLRDRTGAILNIGTKRLTLVLKVYYSV